jgi:hypothetical protein
MPNKVDHKAVCGPTSTPNTGQSTWYHVECGCIHGVVIDSKAS